MSPSGGSGRLMYTANIREGGFFGPRVVFSSLRTLPAMESEAKAGSPRKASARACRRRGAGAAGPGAVEAVCRAHPTRRRAIRRRVMAESDRPRRGLVVTAP